MSNMTGQEKTGNSSVPRITDSCEYGHILPKYRHLLDLTDKERIFENRREQWFNYTEANHIIAQIEKLYQMPHQTRYNGVLIYAEANNGKSRLVDKFYRMHPVEENIGGRMSYIPVVVVEAPPKPDLRWLLNDMLQFMNLPYLKSRDIEPIFRQVAEVFERFGVRTLIIDEIADLFGGRQDSQRECLRFIKRMSNDFGIPIILTGTPDVLSAISTNRQVYSRFKKIEIPIWKDDVNLVGFVGTFEKIAPLKKASDLIKPENREITSIIHSKSGGRIGWIIEILQDAVESAITSGEERITKEIIVSIEAKILDPDEFKPGE